METLVVPIKRGNTISNRPSKQASNTTDRPTHRPLSNILHKSADPNFIRQKRPCGTTCCYSQSEVYDIGTELQFFHCFVTKIIRSFYESVIPQDSESSRRDLACYNIKTGFLTLWDFFFENVHASLDSQLIRYFAQKVPEGRLSCSKYIAMIHNQDAWP